MHPNYDHQQWPNTRKQQSSISPHSSMSSEQTTLRQEDDQHQSPDIETQSLIVPPHDQHQPQQNHAAKGSQTIEATEISQGQASSKLLPSSKTKSKEGEEGELDDPPISDYGRSHHSFNSSYNNYEPAIEPSPSRQKQSHTTEQLSPSTTQHHRSQLQQFNQPSRIPAHKHSQLQNSSTPKNPQTTQNNDTGHDKLDLTPSLKPEDQNSPTVREEETDEKSSYLPRGYDGNPHHSSTNNNFPDHNRPKLEESSPYVESISPIAPSLHGYQQLESQPKLPHQLQHSHPEKHQIPNNSQTTQTTNISEGEPNSSLPNAAKTQNRNSINDEREEAKLNQPKRDSRSKYDYTSSSFDDNEPVSWSQQQPTIPGQESLVKPQPHNRYQPQQPAIPGQESLVKPQPHNRYQPQQPTIPGQESLVKPQPHNRYQPQQPTIPGQHLLRKTSEHEPYQSQKPVIPGQQSLRRHQTHQTHQTAPSDIDTFSTPYQTRQNNNTVAVVRIPIDIDLTDSTVDETSLREIFRQACSRGIQAGNIVDLSDKPEQQLEQLRRARVWQTVNSTSTPKLRITQAVQTNIRGLQKSEQSISTQIDENNNITHTEAVTEEPQQNAETGLLKRLAASLKLADRFTTPSPEDFQQNYTAQIQDVDQFDTNYQPYQWTEASMLIEALSFDSATFLDQYSESAQDIESEHVALYKMRKLINETEQSLRQQPLSFKIDPDVERTLSDLDLDVQEKKLIQTGISRLVEKIIIEEAKKTYEERPELSYQQCKHIIKESSIKKFHQIHQELTQHPAFRLIEKNVAIYFRDTVSNL